MKTEEEVIQWFLEGDPAVRWQMLRDLTDADEIMIASEKANISFRLLLQIRNKLLDAYQEVMRMQF